MDWMIRQDISFAIYRLPNQPEPILLIGKENETIGSIEALSDADGFVMAPFCVGENSPVLCMKPEKTIKGVEAISEYLNNLAVERSVVDICSEEIKGHAIENFAAYKIAYTSFIEALHAKRFSKLVLSRAVDFVLDSILSPAALFSEALEYVNSFVYLCHTPETGTWLGSTPELLLEGDSEVWKTVALAGTREKGSDDVDIEWDPKNRKEQQLVSDYIKEILTDLNLSYQESPTHTITAGKVEHLKTGFTFRMDKHIRRHLGKLLDRLHPTPAVCGLPKKEALQFIVANEGYERAYYSGFVGYMDESITNLYVNLRCMNIKPDSLRLYAGGGLLSSSHLMTEWNETTSKLQTMLSLLDMDSVN